MSLSSLLEEIVGEHSRFDEIFKQFADEDFLGNVIRAELNIHSDETELTIIEELANYDEKGVLN